MCYTGREGGLPSAALPLALPGFPADTKEWYFRFFYLPIESSGCRNKQLASFVGEGLYNSPLLQMMHAKREAIFLTF